MSAHGSPRSRPAAGRRALAAWAALCCACGYTALPAAGPLGEGRRVQIATLRNDTAEVGVEGRVSDALRSELLRQGDARLVERAEAADWRIEGSVAELRGRSRTFSADVRALEIELFLRLELRVSDSEGRRLPLAAHALAARETYLSSPDLEVQRRHRREALDRLARVLAERVVRELRWSAVGESGGSGGDGESGSGREAPGG